MSEIKGGDKHNAIPREAYAKIAIRIGEKSRFIAKVKAETQDVADEIRPIDPDFKLDIKDGEKMNSVFDTTSARNLLNLVHGLPHGVYKMSYDIPGLVETSTNLATITTNDDSVVISMSSRSAVKSELQDMRDRIRAIAGLCGAKVTEETPYPGWKPNLDSKLLKLAKKVYKDMEKQDPKVEAVHAGLECGIIGEKFPGMDMISIGPTIKHLHSPEEQVSVSSVENLYKYVVKILETF
jgi:dipeptidase D